MDELVTKYRHISELYNSKCQANKLLDAIEKIGDINDDKKLVQNINFVCIQLKISEIVASFKETDNKEQSKNTKSGFIYCFKNEIYKYYGDNVRKLGTSVSSKDRVKGFSTPYIKPTEIVLSYKVKNHRLAETLLFAFLEPYRIVYNREFFDCDDTLLRDVFEYVTDLMNKYDKIFIERIIKSAHGLRVCFVDSKTEQIRIQTNILVSASNDKKGIVPVQSKNYVCDACNYVTDRRYCLERHHMSIRHKKNISKVKKETSRKLYCNLCGKKFNHRSSLSRHKRECRGEKVNTDAIDFLLMNKQLNELEKKFELQESIIKKLDERLEG